jgi:nitrogen regulatory protein PII
MTDQPQDTETPGKKHRLHSLKKIEIIVRGEKEKFVQDLLEECGATGYTIHRDIAGRGSHGFHEGRLLFNDRAGLVMFFTVGDEEMIDCVMDGLTPLFEKSSGVMFVSDTQVVRLEKFLEEDE